jgi:hypothetical protein
MSTDTPKSIVPEGVSIYLAPTHSVWRWAARRLEEIEDKIMVACRRGDMKRAEARVWIAQNIAPLEDSFLQGDRSIELVNAIVDLESPVAWPDSICPAPTVGVLRDVPRRDPKDK